MKLILAIIVLTLSTSPYAQTKSDIKIEKTKQHKKKEVDIKTNGKISTSGCETASGKKLNQGEQGYEECVRQIGTK